MAKFCKNAICRPDGLTIDDVGTFLKGSVTNFSSSGSGKFLWRKHQPAFGEHWFMVWEMLQKAKKVNKFFLRESHIKPEFTIKYRQIGFQITEQQWTWPDL